MAQFQPDPRLTQDALADLIAQAGSFVAYQYGAIEQQLIARVAFYVKRDLETPPDVSARLLAIQRLRRESIEIARQLNVAEVARQLVAVAAEQGEAAAVARIGYLPVGASAAPIPATSAAAMAQLTLNLANDLDKMSDRIIRWAPDVYRRTTAITAPEVLLGTSTLDQARRRSVERLMSQGVTGFTDTAGRDWKIGTYAEMTTRTTVHRAWQDANIERVRTSTGISLHTIVRGVDSCKPCSRWGGKIISTDGTAAGTYMLQHATEDRLVEVVVAGTIEQARADGWDHPNCRCVVTAYMPGLSLPANDTNTYDPERERAREQLRALERRVRDLKREQAAATDELEAKRLGRKAREVQKRIATHSTSTGILRDRRREALSFSDGPTVKPPRPESGPRAIEPPGPVPLTR